MLTRRAHPIVLTLAVLVAVIPSPARAQTPATPADTAAVAKPAPPASPIGGIRNKISAGDLLSAESILEVYKARAGEDSTYCSGLAWLARGALALGNIEKAIRYTSQARSKIEARIANGDRVDRDSELETALGAVIETEAQLAQRSKGAATAAAGLRKEIAKYPDTPVAFRSRLHKRLNMLSMSGTPAPEWDAEDWIGSRPPTLASLRGKPVLLFIWAENCGDSRAEAATLAKIETRHAAEGLQLVALSRYYDPPEKRLAEKVRADSVWKASYAAVGEIPMLISTASMIAYGGSSTPTFVFIDRTGIVREYTPTRLTDAEFEKRLGLILGSPPARARK